MSQGCALLILGSKGQRSRSWRMVIWKWFPDDNWLCNQPMIMKLHTLTHHESRMRPIDFEVQRSRSWRMVIWKWFPDDNWLYNQPMVMKLHTLTHHESRMRPIDFEVQRSRSWRMVIWKWFPDDNWLCNQPMIMKLHTLTHHESRMCPIDFEVKGQGHGAWLFENGFRTITDSVINQWSWNFIHLLTMSQGCALLILRSKGQGHGASLLVPHRWNRRGL